MNIIEAIKSGKPFRRKDGPWLIKSEHRDAFDVYPKDVSKNGAFVSPSEVIADDWEIQESTVTITRSQFWDAAIAVGIIDRVDNGMIHFSGSKDKASCLQQLAHKLGLE